MTVFWWCVNAQYLPSELATSPPSRPSGSEFLPFWCFFLTGQGTKWHLTEEPLKNDFVSSSYVPIIPFDAKLICSVWRTRFEIDDTSSHTMIRTST
mmetsp:Transcript_108463/g.187411  ORF Transcript_108463/g.187411 Transcript_108463/m.187411 type:complete len:96 (-) Transcript_108463:1480-1767(-)